MLQPHDPPQIPPPAGWPYLQIQAGSESSPVAWIARIPTDITRLRDITRLHEVAAEEDRAATAAFNEASIASAAAMETDPEAPRPDLGPLIQRRRAAVERYAYICGHIILRTWADPLLDLPPRGRWFDMQYSGVHDAYAVSGADAYADLIDAGLQHGEILDIGLTLALECGRASFHNLNQEVKRKAKVFPTVTTG